MKNKIKSKTSWLGFEDVVDMIKFTSTECCSLCGETKGLLVFVDLRKDMKTLLGLYISNGPQSLFLCPEHLADYMNAFNKSLNGSSPKWNRNKILKLFVKEGQRDWDYQLNLD